MRRSPGRHQLSRALSLLVPEKRDGTTQRKGHQIACFTRKIGRVSRSTLAAEAIALSDTIDLVLWYKCLFAEILVGIFSLTPVMPHHGFPLVTPFKTMQTEQLVLWNKSIKPKETFSVDRISYDPNDHVIRIPCAKCGQSQNS